MQRWLTHMTLVTVLVLCFEYRLTSLPLAEAEQGSDHGRLSQTQKAEIARVRRRLHRLEKAPESATVSFGAWQSEPPLDRFPPNTPTDRTRNEHRLLPNEATIQAGGAVNFVISGFHQPIVYDDGTQPEDIDVDLTTQTTGPTPQPPVVLIDDTMRPRIYRGQDPSLQPLDRGGTAFFQDRVEAVYFPKPGTYLVICGIRGHFLGSDTQPPMYGFVTVK